MTDTEKNKGGRPPVWASPEELKRDIEQCINFIRYKKTRRVKDLSSYETMLKLVKFG